MSRFEEDGAYNALYDRIHPDAHAVIPRAAAVGWFQSDYAPRGPLESSVVNVEIMSWTWEVTGETYERTAVVSYEQPFADGSVDRDVVRLVEYKGKWRWFFGRSRDFVNEQIARFVVTVPDTSGAFSDPIARDVNAFWSTTFGAAELDWDNPDYRAFDGSVRSGCGRASAAEMPALYCPADETIYLDHAFRYLVETHVGDFAWVVVVAHEWGHHVEAELGIRHLDDPGPGGVYSIQLELEADCFAGVYARDAETRGLVSPGDIDEALTLMFAIGDAEGTPWYASDAHGTPDQRATAFMDGYTGGLLGCGYTA